MKPETYKIRRTNYSYPAVGLKGSCGSCSVVDFASTLQLDEHHRALLTHESDDNVVLGYLSTIFWGHFSGKDQKFRPDRAMGKVRLARDGADRIKKSRQERLRGVKDLGVPTVSLVLRKAHEYLVQDEFKEAINILSGLPQLGIAFASKVCAFMAPEKRGVIDSIIATAHPQFGFLLDRQHILKNCTQNKKHYVQYCKFLQKEAEALNSYGAPYYWTDRDGVHHAWRALDVERAMY